MLTLTTPIFVTLLADAFDRTLRARALVAAFLSVLGAAAIVVQRALGRRTQLSPDTTRRASRTYSSGENPS